MRTLLVAWASVCAVAGCATTGKVCSPPMLSETSAATIVVYRPSHFYGVLYTAPITIDGCRIGDLSNGSSIVHQVTPGKHIVRAESEWYAAGGDGEATGIFESGETYYIKYVLGATDVWAGGNMFGWTQYSGMLPMSEKEAKRDLGELR